MKKALGFVVLLIVFLLFTEIAQSWTSNDSLWAGQNMLVGESRTLAQETGILISIKPYSPWKITELHVAIALNDPCLIPTTGNNCDGNPKIGHFPYKLTIPPSSNQQMIFVSYEDLGIDPSGGTYTLYIAVHAVVVQTDAYGEIIEDETAWGGPCHLEWIPGTPVAYPFYSFNGSRWGYYRELVLTF